MGKIALDSVPEKTGSIYPAPYAAMMKGRSSLRLGEAGGLTQFGVNLVTLERGALSSLRHWHRHEDEFILVTEGTLILIDEDGETEMRAGDCAAFPAGTGNGHHLRNDSGRLARFLVVGSRSPREEVHYADIDMKAVIEQGSATFTRKDGSPLPHREKGEIENG